MLVNVPTTHVVVRNSYITDNEVTTGCTEGYLVAARCRPSEAIHWTVHLENGALYSGLPINAIYHIENKAASLYNTIGLEATQPWSCLPGPASAVELDYLRNYDVKLSSPDLEYPECSEGRYLFTIDYAGTGLAADPQQYKMHHIISLVDGPLVAMPNNYLVFKDKHFTADSPDEVLPLSALRRTTKYYRTY